MVSALVAPRSAGVMPGAIPLPAAVPLYAALRRAPVGFVHVDADGVIVLANAAAALLLGTTPQALLDGDCAEWIAPADGTELAAFSAGRVRLHTARGRNTDAEALSLPLVVAGEPGRLLVLFAPPPRTARRCGRCGGPAPAGERCSDCRHDPRLPVRLALLPVLIAMLVVATAAVTVALRLVG